MLSPLVTDSTNYKVRVFLYVHTHSFMLSLSSGNMSVDAERGASDAVTKARHMSGVMLKARHMREQEPCE